MIRRRNIVRASPVTPVKRPPKGFRACLATVWRRDESHAIITKNNVLLYRIYVVIILTCEELATD